MDNIIEECSGIIEEFQDKAIENTVVEAEIEEENVEVVENIETPTEEVKTEE